MKESKNNPGPSMGVQAGVYLQPTFLSYRICRTVFALLRHWMPTVADGPF
jgi:hypothetical protein